MTEVNRSSRPDRARWPSLNQQERVPVPHSLPPVPVLPGRSVILTGGSHGLGAGLFAALYAQGARLLVLGSRFSAGQRAAAADPARVALRYTDLSNPTTLPTALELGAFLAGAGGGEAVLLHAAAMVEPAGPVGTLDGLDIDAAVHVNVLTPMWLTNLFLGAAPPDLRRLRIVYVTTRAAQQAAADSAVYRATKAAGEMFMRCVQAAGDPRCAVDLVDAGATDLVDPHAAADIVADLFA